MKIAVIGGSGIYNIEGVEKIAEEEITTPFGHPSSAIAKLKLAGHEFYFLPRHGVGHVFLPSEINYRANIFALKSQGVESIISISAVGSLQEEHGPGDFVIPDQFIDWTKGFRKRSFYGDGIVGHVSCAEPIHKKLAEIVFECSQSSKIKTSLGGSYLCIEGPQFSTRAESHIYRGFGAQVIGMTNVPEAFLAKEAGIAYATVAMVTDYDCWKEEYCTVDEIMRVMNQNNKSAHILLKNLLPALQNLKLEIPQDYKYAVVTAKEKLTKEQNEMISLLQR